MRRFLCYLVAGWSGYFVMALELLGGRALAPYFGSSIHVWGALIAVFMLALSAGYLAGGAWSRRSPSLPRLALLLAAAALAAVPVALGGDPLLDALSLRIADPRLGSLLGASALFLLPTAISGMVSPYAVRLLVDDSAGAGAAAGRLYFVSTFGSAAGTLLTSFYLVLWFELATLLWAMIGVSLAVALVVALARRPGNGNGSGASGGGQRGVAASGPAAVLALAAGLVLAGGAAPARAAEPQLVHEERSLYRQVLVYEQPGERCLCFTRRCSIGRQSCIDPAQPDRLLFSYTRMMLAALFLVPEPRHVLVVGLGGGTLPRTLARLLPAADIDAVEIDPAVVAVAGRYFGFEPGPRMHVATEDGRTWVRRAGREGRRYDLVMLDAYDQQYIPEHMLTLEFLGEVRALLAPGGVVAANTFSSSRLYDNESVTYARAFGPFYNLRTGNRVILARPDGLPPMAGVRAAAAAWAPRLAPLGADPAALLPLFNAGADWNANARVLTDQYSPANLLNSSR